MSQVNSIVDVSISVESARISRASFGAGLLISKSALFADSVKLYTDPSELLDDGFSESDTTYLAALEYFAQENGAANMYVGRRAASYVLTVTVADSTVYSVVIGGVTYSFTSGSGASYATIRTGLNAAINAATATHGFAAANVSTNQISLIPVTGRVGLLVGAVSAQLAKSAASYSATIAADLDRMSEASADWYGIVLCDRDNTEATAVATWCASSSAPKVFPYASADGDIINSADETTSLAYSFKNTGFRRSWVFYHSLAATRYPDAALLSRILAMDPGSYTVKFKTLDNLAADALTDSQCAVARAKYAMVYIQAGGVKFVQEGVTAEGEYIDVIIGIDWNTAIIRENVFGTLVSSPKVPYTDAGIAAIEGQVRAGVQTGVDQGLYAAIPAPTFSVPKAKDVSGADKASRTLRNVKFFATLAGAIHFVQVRGTVTY